jgi:hypothetical protein
MKQPSEVPVNKKPYQSPQLLVYGDLTQMTQSKGTSGSLDRGGGKLRRTGH